MTLQQDLEHLEALFSDEAEEPIIFCLNQEKALAAHVGERYGGPYLEDFQDICSIAFIAHCDLVNSRGTLNRMGGHPYYTHCVNVAYALVFLAEEVLGYTVELDDLMAAIMHDVVEDTDIPAGILNSLLAMPFFEKVFLLTRDQVPPAEKEENQKVYYQRMLDKDPSVLTIKAMDGMHNVWSSVAFAKRGAEKDASEVKTLKKKLGSLGKKVLNHLVPALEKRGLPQDARTCAMLSALSLEALELQKEL